MLTTVSTDAEIEFVTGQMLKKLLENSLAGMHWYPPVKTEGIIRNEFKSKKEQLCQRTIRISKLQTYNQILPDSSELLTQK
jgi:hypothetical protein